LLKSVDQLGMPSALPYLALEEREGGKVSKGGKGTATVLLHKAGQVWGEDYITPLVLRELWRIIVLRFFGLLLIGRGLL